MIRKTLAALVLASLAAPLAAQTMTLAHQPGMIHSKAAPDTPGEPGQGAFGAIAEIVALLRADPQTDWSRVDITALRAHLVDMDLLVSEAQVVATPLPDGLRMSIATTGAAGGAVRRMVPAHSPVLAAETGWTSDIAPEGDALIWTVSSATDAAIIQGFGFFGLMTTGNHHAAHHLALARGSAPH